MEVPSTVTAAILYPEEGVMVYVMLLPFLTDAVPLGEMLPPVPALAEMEYLDQLVPVLPDVVALKAAEIEWLAVTPLKV